MSCICMAKTWLSVSDQGQPWNEVWVEQQFCRASSSERLYFGGAFAFVTVF